MKQELIALSPAAVLSIFVAGVMGGTLVAGGGTFAYFFVMVAMLAYSWQDSREPWQSGMWKRGWMRWSRTGESV